MKPLFSCVVAVKGPRPFFDAALASLHDQGMGKELEIIVQDGDVEPDRGQSDAFNRGFSKAKGEWLFWLNADDILLPGALKKVSESTHYQRPTTNWIAGNQIYIDEDGRVVRCLRGNGWHDWLYREAVPHVNGPSAFFRRELFECAGGFDDSLDVCMDWDLWIRFRKTGARFTRIDDYLWAQRQWSGSKTQRTKPPEEESRQAAEVQRMLAKNGYRMSRKGDFGIRLWRTLNGNYLRGAWDTLRMKGNPL